MNSLPSAHEAIIPQPTSDGGIEHTAAQFLPPSFWLSKARSGEIVLFPPQFFLLHLISPFLSPEGSSDTMNSEELSRRRQSLIDFVKTGSPSWSDKCISPSTLLFRKKDQRSILALDKPGLELERSSKGGDSERVILVKFSKEGPTNVEVAWKKDILQEEREQKL
ncbi:MAG: hypothetical protein M1819_005477 [Sarea resinae]|nr:MAG: hypothetical protein M1819_005477 [Sarea resinae]